MAGPAATAERPPSRPRSPSPAAASPRRSNRPAGRRSHRQNRRMPIRPFSWLSRSSNCSTAELRRHHLHRHRGQRHRRHHRRRPFCRAWCKARSLQPRSWPRPRRRHRLHPFRRAWCKARSLQPRSWPRPRRRHRLHPFRRAWCKPRSLQPRSWPRPRRRLRHRLRLRHLHRRHLRPYTSRGSSKARTATAPRRALAARGLLRRFPLQTGHWPTASSAFRSAGRNACCEYRWCRGPGVSSRAGR